MFHSTSLRSTLIDPLNASLRYDYRDWWAQTTTNTECLVLGVCSSSATAAPVDKELTKALKNDLSKRGLPEVKTPKPKSIKFNY